MMGDKADPPSAVGGLEGIDKRVGSRGKKKKAKEKVYKRRQTYLRARSVDAVGSACPPVPCDAIASHIR
jgi:hypothetical protein